MLLLDGACRIRLPHIQSRVASQTCRSGCILFPTNSFPALYPKRLSLDTWSTQKIIEKWRYFEQKLKWMHDISLQRKQIWRYFSINYAHEAHSSPSLITFRFQKGHQLRFIRDRLWQKPNSWPKEYLLQEIILKLPKTRETESAEGCGI